MKSHISSQVCCALAERAKSISVLLQVVEPFGGQPEDEVVEVAEVLAAHRAGLRTRRDALDDDGELEVRERLVPGQVVEVDAGGGGVPVEHLGPGGDRKSTRLNSSHVKISYA